MSYILEALKKFERKREQTDLINSLNFLGALEPEPKKKPWWPYLVIAALLLNAGIMTWWIAPWRAERKVSSAHPTPILSPKVAMTKMNEKNEPGRTGEITEIPPSKILPVSPKPEVEKNILGRSKAASEKVQKAKPIPRKSPEVNKGASGLIPPQPMATQAKAISKKSESQLGKKIIYFKDGTSEVCDDFQVTANFIHCTKKGGGSITNLNKVDQGKTLSGKTP